MRRPIVAQPPVYDTISASQTDETYTISTTGSHEIRRVKGNTQSEPVYLLKGVIPSGTNTYVSLRTNDDELRVVGVLDSGETLRNGLPCLQELNFPVLQKGVNTVAVGVTGATFTELRIQAQSRWR